MKIPLVLALVLALPVPAMAQYMYLDSNGNGVSDAGDMLNPNGTPTTVDLYVITNQNRDGSTAVGDNGPEPLEILSYVINLLASGGTVTYQDFINRQPAMSSNFGELNSDGLRYKNGFGGGARLAPGKYRLSTLTITGVSGRSRIDIVDMVTGSLDYTSFGTPCWGMAWDDTYKLDGPNTRDYQGVADFYDADGLAPWDGPAMTNPGNKTVNEQALLQFTVAATDPGRTLTYSLTLGVPAATGATINPSTGVFSWTPTVAQGPGVYPVTVTATNNASTPLSASAAFTITVNDATTTHQEPESTGNSGGGCGGSASPVAAGSTAFLIMILMSRALRLRGV